MRQIKSALFLLCLASSSAWAADALLLNVSVNGIAQGDLPAIFDDGQYWLQLDALKKAGLPLAAGESKDFDGIPYLLITKINHVSAHVDEATLRAELTARAEDLGEHVIDVNIDHPEKYPSPAAWSGYLDYNISAFKVGNSETGYGVAPTLNLSKGYWNLRSSHDYQSNGREKDWLRLDTTLTLDQPDIMARTTFGDITPAAGELSHSRPMAGIGFSRVFAMQPDFSSSPSMNASTSVTTSSTAEIYLNGQRINTINLAPGMYTFEDLRYYSGMQDITLVIKDSYGRSQTVAMPFYFDDSLLKAGLQEFSYNIGMARVAGSFDRYEGLAYSAYHKVGVTDWLTVGLQADGAEDDRSAGALARVKVGEYGVLAGTYAKAQHEDGTSGAAALAHYRFESRDFSVFASGQKQSEYFIPRSDLIDPTLIPRWSASAGIGFGHGNSGNWNFEAARQVGGVDATYNRYRGSYSISPFRQLTLSTSLSLRNGVDDQRWSGFVNLSWYFDRSLNLYTSTQYDNERYLSSASVSNTPPNGEGWAYNAGVNQTTSGTDYTGWLQNKMRYGQADVSYYRSEADGQTINSWRAGYAGSLAFAGERFAATRPINQSFAVIAAAGLPNIGVYQNGEVVGRTNSDGELFIPNLSSYGYHQIGLMQADIPMDVSLEKLSSNVFTANNDGRVLTFSGQRIRAVSGKLTLPNATPIRNRSISVNGISGATTLDGDFYLEGLAAGKYQINVGEQCRATLTIPEQNEVVFDAGVLRCEGNAP